MLHEEFEKFEKFNLDEVVHKGRDINFNEVRQPLDELYGMFSTMVNSAKAFPLNDGIATPLHALLLHFNNLLNQLLIYDFRNDNQATFNNLKQSVTNLYREYFRLNKGEGGISPDRQNSDFLLIYNFIKQRALNPLIELETNTKTKLDEIEKAAIQQINSFEERFNLFKADAESTLALLNKEAGKIGVKNYAEIFESQANEHSRLFKEGIGKAQGWLLAAVIFFIVLIISMTQLDRIFSLNGAVSFTPEVVVHVLGRFLLISLIIFIVSFSFKQFRINMHLYTLNKHRANTLKSFEYLTKAPDQLAPESYNAILMEVAKAIYEAGQTGYISGDDNRSDLPSIVDMTKVITQSKGI